MSDENLKKDPWESGWDAVEADHESAEDVVTGALSCLSLGYDLTDRDSRLELALFLINSAARELTFPQPSEEDQDPLDTPEKEAAFGEKMNSLAHHLAAAYAQWEIHEGHGKCDACQGTPQPKNDTPTKPN